MRQSLLKLLTWLLLIGLFFISVTALIILKPNQTPPFESVEFNASIPAQTESLFSNVTASAGITATRNNLDKITGQAWGDYNNDGWLDLYLTNTTGPNTLFENNGDGTFSPSVYAKNIALPESISGGVTFADYDNDGWLDLYVMNWGTNTLFHNEQGNGFSDVTELAGVGDESNGKTASWGDYDNDGWLDLYVANWACSPKCGRPTSGDKDRLYHNNGDGTFSDVTTLLGNNTRGAGFVATFVDYDNDGDLDIYLVNDEFINPVGNKLWRNDGPGGDEGWQFTEVSVDAGANITVMGMGLATGDYDSDGDLDFYFSNAGPMTLLQNQGDGRFSDIAPLAGVDLGREAIGWGAVFFEANNDGLPDLYLALADRTDGLPAANPLFINNGDGSFSNLGLDSGAADSGKTIGVAYADYDNDGWLDLVIGNYNSGYELYHNQGASQSDNRRIAIKLIGAGPINRDAVGARVYLSTDDGRTQLQEIKNGSSLGSGDTLILHFGLGRASITEMKVVWSDDTTQTFNDVPANRFLTLIYPLEPQSETSPLWRWIFLGLLLLSVVGMGLLFLYQLAQYSIWQIWKRIAL